MGSASSTPVSASSNAPSAAAPPPGCPMHESTSSSSSVAGGSSASASTSTMADALNPLNNIPALSQSPLSPSQRTFLSRERSTSSIPRVSNSDTSAGACPVVHTSGKDANATPDPAVEHDGRWVYPSPQQFYNALMRKGKDTPEESIEVMVQIHNFLNERAWDEVRRWEDIRDPNAAQRIELSKFEGRPQDLSPKARFHLMLASIFPDSYSSQPPFDRHDWFVRRPADGSSQRYVIDYYSAPDDEQGNPVFSLDVRPAIDSPGAMYERMAEWTRIKREAWSKASATEKAGTPSTAAAAANALSGRS